MEKKKIAISNPENEEKISKINATFNKNAESPQQFNGLQF